eukprot:TRINITY_DN32973_c0_g1_i5.p1 TRINITY_DN32973_c0_g1~~TRINITY_DN32973_c0_g1_i5.p1  ORF type:complete len:807 (+),score=153.65 TRINITY_DN32973_c0_g1_i5:1781-4201(+)
MHGRRQQDLIDSIAQKSMYAFEEKDIKTAHRLMKQLKPYRPRQHNMAKKKDGLHARDQEEADEVWRQHWAELMNGKETSFEALYEQSRKDVREEEDFFNVTNILPTSDELAYRIQRAKAAKAHGGDRLPIEVYKMAPTEASEVVQKLATKIITSRQWPVQWQGDVHVPIPKGGGRVRGVSLEDAGAKIVTAHLRGHLIKKVEEQAPRDTYGAIGGRGTDLAVHLRNQIEDYMQVTGSSYAMLFVDLVSAFDKTCRAYMQKVHDTGDPEYEITSTIHRRTWVITPFGNTPVETSSGVKQGDPIADAAFVSTMSCIINKIRARLIQQDICMQFSTRAGSILSGEGIEGEKIDIVEVTYIDDIMVSIPTDNPLNLEDKVREAMKIIKEEVGRAGFTVNLSRGKTEAVIHFQGSNSLEAKRKLQQDEYKIDIGNNETIIATDMYKHLGTKHSSRAGTMHHARAAINKMAEKEAEYRTALRSKRYDEDTKKKIVTVIMSAVLYAIHTVTGFTKAQLDMMERRYMMMIRRTFGEVHAEQDQARLSNYQVRVTYELPSMKTLIRLRRLRYLPRLMERAPLSLRTIVQVNEKLLREAGKRSWAQQIREDMKWLQDHVQSLEEMPCPLENPGRWEDRISAETGWWQARLKEIYEADKKGMIVDQDPEDANLVYDGETWECRACSIAFSTVQGYHLHCFKKHQRIARAQFYAPAEARCWWCNRSYPSRIALVTHLQRGLKKKQAGSCLGQMMICEFEPLPHEHVYMLKEEDARQRRDNRSRGKPPASGNGVWLRHFGPTRMLRYGPLSCSAEHCYG